LEPAARVGTIILPKLCQQQNVSIGSFATGSIETFYAKPISLSNWWVFYHKQRMGGKSTCVLFVSPGIGVVKVIEIR
jgi:hypothetical protein